MQDVNAGRDEMGRSVRTTSKDVTKSTVFQVSEIIIFKCYSRTFSAPPSLKYTHKKNETFLLPNLFILRKLAYSL